MFALLNHYVLGGKVIFYTAVDNYYTDKRFFW